MANYETVEEDPRQPDRVEMARILSTRFLLLAAAIEKKETIARDHLVALFNDAALYFHVCFDMKYADQPVEALETILKELLPETCLPMEMDYFDIAGEIVTGLSGSVVFFPKKDHDDMLTEIGKLHERLRKYES